MTATRSLEAVGAVLARLNMDETSAAYVLDILQTDDEATADANALYEAIGPFLESSSNSGSVVDGLAECRNILKAWPPKRAGRSDTLLTAPVLIAASEVPAAALCTCSCAVCTKAGVKSKDCLREPAVNETSEEEKENVADGERAAHEETVKAGSHSSDEDWGDELDEMVFASTGSRGRTALNNSNDVRITNVHLSVRNVDLLVNASLTLYYGRRYGLLGRNGCGKSTLMDRIARGLIKDFPAHVRVLLVRQEINGDDRTVLQTVLDSDEERTALLTEEAALQRDPAANAQRLSEVHDRLSEVDAAGAEARARQLLHQLGFSEEQMMQATRELSGGWKKRTALAGVALVAKSLHLLLLDEPTPHLDLPTILWLQRFLRTSFSGTLLVVSHDGGFLDAVCTDMVHFHRKQLFYFPCGFSDLMRVLDDKRKKKMHLQENLDKQRDRIKKSVAKMTQVAQGNKLDQKRFNLIASRKKKLNRMGFEKTEDGRKWNCQSHGIRAGSVNANEGGWSGRHRSAGSQLEVIDPALKFSFSEAEPLGTHGAIVSLSEVAFGYAAGELLFSGVTLPVAADSRIGILGANGSGKSTILQLLVGQLEPQRGEVTRQRNAVVGYFSQHHVDQLDLALTPIEQLTRLHPTATQKEVRGQLAAYGVHAELATRPIGRLSGGQRSRVVFAIITWRPPHLLLLDEPTNSLDYETVEAVREAVEAFEGAVVVVSHHQTFVDALGLDLYVLHDKRLAPYEGTFADYLQELSADAAE